MTPQASLHATDRSVAPPCRAFDTGLRPGPFPNRAASLLPGLLAATRTGLPPASDDELTTTDQPPTRSTSCLLGARENLSERQTFEVGRASLRYRVAASAKSRIQVLDTLPFSLVRGGWLSPGGPGSGSSRSGNRRPPSMSPT